MKTKKFLPSLVTITLCFALIVIMGAVGATPAQAAQDAQTGNPPLWFKFSVGRVEDENSTRVSVTLNDQATCGNQFQVFSSGGWSYWDVPEEEDVMGVSTSTDHDSSLWVGKLVPGTYYVRMGSGAHLPCVLGVSGQNTQNLGAINFGYHPAPVVMGPTAVQVPAQMPAISSAPAMEVTTANIAPAPVIRQMTSSALVPNKWIHVTNNDPIVITFRVGRVLDDDDNDSPANRISVTLKGEPNHAGEFQVFDGSGATLTNPQEEDWIGHSNEIDDENPAWYGELLPGTYQVRVEPQGMRELLLSVSGEAISY
jgi:hypothetical protein